MTRIVVTPSVSEGLGGAGGARNRLLRAAHSAQAARYAGHDMGVA